MFHTLKHAGLLGTALLLAGCASVDFDQALSTAGTQAQLPAALQLHQTDDQRQQAQKRVNELLAVPLSSTAAVQLALLNSPTLQALLAQSWAEMAQADQSARLANPVFQFERMRLGDELEIGRLLSFGLLELLTLPRRQAIAQDRLAQAQTQLAATVVDEVAQVRQSWVNAVAAQQSLAYAQQVNKAARAGAELARRMQQAGNFNKLQRAREQSFHADSAAQLALAQHTAAATREALIRRLGLTDQQATALRLPERLPDLPAQPESPAALNQAARDQRLDVRLARQQLDAAGKAQGLDLLTSLLDVELGVRHDSIFDNAGGSSATRRGFELDVRLPLFDWGSAQRAAMNAQTLAAANRYEATTRAATSQLRESYATYRTAYAVARHYRDEIVPLRQLIADENQLRYNGMLIGVFELLADARERISSVQAALNAQQQFWLADAALTAALLGQPNQGSTGLRASSTGSTSNAAAAH